MKKISLNFEGYWTIQNSVPSRSGVYCVYRGKDKGETVSISQLLYVGESENMHDRVVCHERLPDWRRCLMPGESLIFSAAPIVLGRLQAEAAIIHHHKPKLNSEYRDTFPFEDTEMSLSGRISELNSYFVVKTTLSLASLLFNRTSSRSY